MNNRDTDSLTALGWIARGYTRSDIQEELQISSRTLDRRIQRGKILYQSLTGSPLVHLSSLVIDSVFRRLEIQLPPEFSIQMDEGEQW